MYYVDANIYDEHWYKIPIDDVDYEEYVNLIENKQPILKMINGVPVRFDIFETTDMENKEIEKICVTYRSYNDMIQACNY